MGAQISFLIYVNYVLHWKTRETTRIRLSKNWPEQKLAIDFRFRFCFLLDLIFYFLGGKLVKPQDVVFFKSVSAQIRNLFPFPLCLLDFFFIGKILKPQDYVLL